MPAITRDGSTRVLPALRDAMEQHIPAALQTALYVGSGAVTVMAVALIVLLLKVRGQLERVARSVEELTAEMTPLAREMRVVVGDLRGLTGRAQERWMEVEGLIDTARSWSRRADRLVGGLVSTVKPPMLAVSRKVVILFKGLETFVREFTPRA